MIRVMLVEDNKVVRDSMVQLLKYEDQIMVTGVAEDSISALEFLAKGTPPIDVILADLNMPGMDGIELTEQVSLLYETVKVIILTMHEKQAFIEKAFTAGAKGYLLKDADIDKLCDSIARVHKGETVLDNNLLMGKF